MAEGQGFLVGSARGPCETTAAAESMELPSSSATEQHRSAARRSPGFFFPTCVVSLSRRRRRRSIVMSLASPEFLSPPTRGGGVYNIGDVLTRLAVVRWVRGVGSACRRPKPFDHHHHHHQVALKYSQPPMYSIICIRIILVGRCILSSIPFRSPTYNLPGYFNILYTLDFQPYLT